MNVHDWLQNLPFADPEGSCRVVEISFNQGSRKEFYRNPSLQYFDTGELVAVEGTAGYDVGEISLKGELVRLQLKKRGVPEFAPDMKKILRRAGEVEISKWKEAKAREKDILVRSRAAARQIGLQMKIAEVELQADGKKATFFYTADDRVDFRELIRVYAGEFKVKVEMRQIGARQEAGKVGGIGSCGRELCCSTWLTDFKSVNTGAARYQNLSINQTKLSGQCGRLKCCLNYELDTYLDALQAFPNNADELLTTRGKAFLVKKDIFKNLMWYTLPDSSKQYPLTIQRVIEIKQLNQKGTAVEELQPVEIVSSKPVEKEPEFVDVVGQISLRSLDKKKPRQGPPPPDNRNQRGPQNAPPQGRRQDGPPQQNRPAPPQQNRPAAPQQNRPPMQGKDDSLQANNPAEQQRGPQQRPANQQPNNQRPPRQQPPAGNPPPQNRGPQNRPPQQRGPQQPNRPPQGEGRPPQGGNNRPPQGNRQGPPPENRNQRPPQQNRRPDGAPNQHKNTPPDTNTPSEN
jgi:cell fate regulator YaaT (PSP1 superfamily)